MRKTNNRVDATDDKIPLWSLGETQPIRLRPAKRIMANSTQTRTSTKLSSLLASRPQPYRQYIMATDRYSVEGPKASASLFHILIIGYSRKQSIGFQFTNTVGLLYRQNTQS